jgi:hypothetical protein
MNDQERGALHLPRLFRRSTGAHAILAAVLGADLAETILLVLFGGLAGPPFLWLARTAFLWLHTSLIADIALLLVLGLFTAALTSKIVEKTTNAATWGCAVMYSVPIVILFALLWLLKPDWIAIHASVIPIRAPEPFAQKESSSTVRMPLNLGEMTRKVSSFQRFIETITRHEAPLGAPVHMKPLGRGRKA